MAAADTIVILDGLQFTKPDTADIWTIDGEGSAYEAVKSYAVQVPASASSVRVIFNNNYDTGASRVHVRVKVTAITAFSSTGVPTKTANTQSLEWTAIAAQGFLETGAIDVSALPVATLHVDCAISSTTAHTGTEILCQMQSEASLDEWVTFASVVGPTGTATKSDFAAEEAAGQTTLSITNPTTGNLNHLGKFIFLEDTVTIAQCEIAYITDCGADT